MPAETFFCPHCKSQLTKSAQSYVMGEMMTNKESYFIALGNMPDTITCPGCSGQIDNNKMLLGEYDPGAGSAGSGGFIGTIIFAGLIALAAYFIWFR